ncbi:hypothetical protein SSM1_234 [Synechococcus phage S-SM1]|uniref:Uncharacterized protein n=1 Tax=Synechococcus phage S-SM1 TaxID=444859 RepID=E3SIP0_9CAUD|nr:hypothetical protein SSM1_234 [Synechococcus phage S-SM1]ADO97117.1 hypothetical protein SSM1_234 [Synechococcus phage S-SM1]
MGWTLLKGVKVIEQDCDPTRADDRTLPYICYLVTYKMDGKVCYDLAITGKEVDLFDYYWDLYRHDFITFKQTEGRVNPKLWNDPNQKSKKTK